MERDREQEIDVCVCEKKRLGVLLFKVCRTVNRDLGSRVQRTLIPVRGCVGTMVVWILLLFSTVVDYTFDTSVKKELTGVNRKYPTKNFLIKSQVSPKYVEIRKLYVTGGWKITHTQKYCN